MSGEPTASSDGERERQSRVRIGVTGLAFVFVAVLLAASFSGTASDEPPLTADTRPESTAVEGVGAANETELPQEPLAELGVAPGAVATDPAEESAPDDPGIVNNLEALDAELR